MSKIRAYNAKNNKCERILEKIFRSHNISPSTYSIGDYSDECVCLEKKNDKWVVYSARRGKKRNEISFDSPYDAAENMAGRICEDTHTKNSIIATLKSFQRFQKDTDDVYRRRGGANRSWYSIYGKNPKRECVQRSGLIIRHEEERTKSLESAYRSYAKKNKKGIIR